MCVHIPGDIDKITNICYTVLIQKEFGFAGEERALAILSKLTGGFLSIGNAACSLRTPIRPDLTAGREGVLSMENGMHTVRRNHNGGLKQIRQEDFKMVEQRIQRDPEALAWLQSHKEVWLKS